MNEYVWVALYTIIELMGYWSAYVCILRAGINKNWWRYFIYIVVVLIIQLGLYYLTRDFTFISLVPAITGIIIPIMLTAKCNKLLLALYPVVIIIVPMVSNITDLVIYKFIGNEAIDTSTFSIWKLLSDFVVVVICFMIYIIIKASNMTPVHFKFSKLQYITLLIGLACCVIFIVCNELYIWQGGINKLGKFLLATAGVLICVVMLIISLIQGVLMSKNAAYKQKQLQYDYFLKLQEQNINALLDRDEQMRRFRHDMHGHMTAIRAMAQETDNKELVLYVERIISESAVFKVERYTGNVTIDAIISDMHRKILEKNINFIYECNVRIGENINSYNVCTIIYNVMKNAIEACEELEIPDRYVHMSMYNMGSNVCYCLTNTCNIREDIENIEEFNTTKHDTENHGIGIRNIRDAVRKSGGIVKFSVKDGEFKVDIVI